MRAYSMARAPSNVTWGASLPHATDAETTSPARARAALRTSMFIACSSHVSEVADVILQIEHRRQQHLADPPVVIVIERNGSRSLQREFDARHDVGVGVEQVPRDA